MPVFSSVTAYLQAEIPVFIPCFNNPTDTGRMVSQLRGLGFQRIVLIDGGSNYPPMRDLLAQPGEGVSLVSMPSNPGPRHLLTDPATFALLPRHFCLTDPDIAFNPDMPEDFLGDLAALAAREKLGKSGLALDISDRGGMRDDDYRIGGRTWKIWEWEAQFWERELEPLRPGADPVYRAHIDTTFTLVDKVFFDPDHPTEALRVAGRLTCRHLPWYIDRSIQADEEQFYRRTERFSYYSRNAAAEGAEPYDEPSALPDPEPADETHLRAYLAALYRSNSWRLTRPLRALAHRLGAPAPDEPLVEKLQYSQLRHRIDAVTASTSWRMTKPLRLVNMRKLFRLSDADSKHNQAG